MRQLFFHSNSDIAALLEGSRQRVPVVYGPINKVVPKFPELKSIYQRRSVALFQEKPGEPLHLALIHTPWENEKKDTGDGVDHTDTVSTALLKSVNMELNKEDIEFSEVDRSEVIRYIASVSFELFHMEKDVDLRDKELLFFSRSEENFLFDVAIEEAEILERFKDIARDKDGAICVCFSIEQSSSRKLNVGPFKQPTKRGHL